MRNLILQEYRRPESSGRSRNDHELVEAYLVFPSILTSWLSTYIPPLREPRLKGAHVDSRQVNPDFVVVHIHPSSKRTENEGCSCCLI